MTYDYYAEDEPEEVTVECSVCGGDAPATMEWCDPDYEAIADFHCSECGEPRCQDCRCACEREEDETPSPIAGLCAQLAQDLTNTGGRMVRFPATNEGKDYDNEPQA